MTAREVAGAESHLNHLLDGDRALPGTRAAINLVLAELDRWRGQITEIYTITETHPDAPPGELLGEVRRLVDNDDHCMTAHQGHPDDLPAVLSSVEDVARVAAAAGLEHTRSAHRGEVTRWVRRPDLGVDLRAEPREVDGALRVVLLVERTDDHHGLAWSAEWYWNGQGGGGIPLAPVWSAIQAARGGAQ